MKTFVCKIHGEIEPYISFHMGSRGKDRIFRCCPTCKSERNKKRYIEKKQEIKEYHAKHYIENRTEHLARSKRYTQNNKAKVFEAYGNKCACCGECHIEFLGVDHINGDGHILRQTTQKGNGVYRELIRLGFPKDNYRILCMNCNFSHGRFGYCPHQKI